MRRLFPVEQERGNKDERCDCCGRRRLRAGCRHRGGPGRLPGDGAGAEGADREKNPGHGKRPLQPDQSPYGSGYLLPGRKSRLCQGRAGPGDGGGNPGMVRRSGYSHKGPERLCLPPVGSGLRRGGGSGHGGRTSGRPDSLRNAGGIDLLQRGK